ncbi:MAG: DUF1365 domain-containing protein [Burkholderiaceae bacterium]|jgi:DUF1365 family protein|nr:DUF1365 domain-containing protein [Burkholderiaceae bacterium]
MTPPRTPAAPSTPLIGFGQVRHARLRPAANRFSYGAYFLRLPLRSLAQRPWRSRMLGLNRSAPMTVLDRDHGDGRPLVQWIDSLLAEHGVTDAHGEVWLHTFPRVFGYVFNPVSFWFAHRTDGSLRAVVCEVNNTFGERHCYLLAHDDGRALAWGEEVVSRKVFHVSPFCAVDGRYRFRFMLSGGEPARFIGCVDHDDAGGPLLQTSLSGTLEPATDRALLRALLAYPAFTFGVIARIHWQALRLFVKRVPFFSKPAPPAHHVTR